MKIWPAINASLNALSACWLVLGFILIRKKKIQAHKRAMLAACTTSLIFLASYLMYHSQAGATRFAGTGWTRPVYFTILISHTILAVIIVPLAIFSVIRGLRMDVARHISVVKWTYPMWLYVSITGVLVYFFLYQWFPG